MTDGKTKKREVRGLVDACRAFGLNSGVIITNDAPETFTIERIKITNIPLSLWLLTDAP
ncbi:MAG: hypothetical protein HY879_28235 [Deltaproteobacteria bacterium]|nr:hypothetical protein [Deltaproteobacteria bacterium]